MLAPRLWLVVLVVGLAACSKSESERPPEVAKGNWPPPNAAPPVDPLVHDEPLAGTMYGREFVPKGAIALPAVDPGKKNVIIADYLLTCDAKYRPKEDGSRYVSFEVPWKGGATADLRDKPALLGTLAMGDWHEEKSTGGRVNVLSASPTVGQTGRLYVRVDWGEWGRDRVEGIIEVRVCPPLPPVPK